MNILIADDEELMLKILTAYFEKEGFKTFAAQDGEEALQLFYTQKIDLAILDWMMPQMDGIEVCRAIKRESHAKVLLLTAKGEFEDELKALQAGADEYIRKPFDPRIVMLRAKKILKVDRKLVIKDLKIDMQGRKINKNDKELNLTKTEFDLIKCLIENKGKVLSRQLLLDSVWGFEFSGDERTLDTHIRRLRGKVGEETIRTHHGMGYSMEDYHE